LYFQTTCLAKSRLRPLKVLLIHALDPPLKEGEKQLRL